MPKTSQKKEPLRVSTNIEGTPVGITMNAKPERITRIYQHWHGSAEGTCGSSRAYYKIRTSKGCIYDIYRESLSQAWHISKIYD
jgi:hypothetical protein